MGAVYLPFKVNKFRLLTFEELANEFEENTFDLIYSNLVLHLITNHNVGLNNIYRIGKPDCKVMISVLGDKNNCNYFRLFNEILKNYTNIESDLRSIYHINDNIEDFKKDLI